MADIDVSFLINDPDFSDQVKLIRKINTINQYGESVVTESEEFITCVVQSSNAEERERLPDGLRNRGSLTLWTLDQIGPIGTGGLPDIVEHKSNRYEIYSILEDFSNYGAGYIKIIAIRENPSDG